MYRPRSSPFGDIYTIPTSVADGVANRLYKQQQLKELQQRQDNQALDNEFAKNMSGMRDADIGDLTNAYGAFKQKSIEVQKKGQRATPQDQLDVLRAKAAVNETIAKSKQQKELEKLHGTDLIKNPNKYVRDAHGKLISIMNTPVSKIGDTDPFEALPYKGNMTNLQKLATVATGKPIDMPDEVVDNPTEMRKDVTHVKRLANAPEYYHSILNQTVGSQGEDDLVRSIASTVTPEIYNQVEAQYNAMMADPITRKRLGMENVDLPPDEGLTDVQQAAKYMAMTHQLIAKPTLKEGTPIYSKNAIMGRQEANQRFMEGLRQSGRKELLGMREQAKQLGIEANDLWADKYMKTLTDEASANTIKTKTITPDGKITVEDRIDPDPLLAKLFTKDGVSPDKIAIMADGRFRPVYYKRDKSGPLKDKDGNFLVDNIASVPISASQFKTSLLGKSGTKQLNTEMSNDNPKTVTHNNEPLDPNGFKKSGKYWKYKDGRLFDDNGKVIKQ